MPLPDKSSIKTILEEEEDWLLGYLATTRYGKDPKLNAATQKVATVAPKVKDPKAVSSRSRRQSVRAIQQQGLNGESETRPGRRASWAATPFSMEAPSAKVLPEPKGSVQPVEIISPADTTDVAHKAVFDAPGAPSSLPLGSAESSAHFKFANSRLSFLQAGSVYHKAVVQPQQQRPPPQTGVDEGPEACGEGDDLQADDGQSDNFHKWAAMSTAGTGGSAYRTRLSTSGPPPSQHRISTARRLSTSRLSISARRQSMDYSELDAVKQRLQHAASLWAVADEAEEDKESQEGEEEERSMQEVEKSRGPGVPDVAEGTGEEGAVGGGEARAAGGMGPPAEGGLTREGLPPSATAPLRLFSAGRAAGNIGQEAPAKAASVGGGGGGKGGGFLKKFMGKG